jgi:hypothetical protein
MAMWNWFNCYLSGRHEFGMWCEPGAIFLRCVHCGRRSSGWSVSGKESAVSHPKVMKAAPTPSRVIPFNRSVAS